MVNAATQKTFGTERLFLMPLGKADLADLHILHSDPEVMKFIREPEKSMDQTQITLDRMLAHTHKHPGFGFWKILTKEEHNFVGWIGVYPLESSAEFELGYRTHSDFWGNGYVVEAAKSLLQHIQDAKLLKSCAAIINPQNARSRRVLEKLNFKEVGKATHYNMTVDKFVLEF